MTVVDGPSLVDKLPPDGRAARKDRNRRAVLDAVIELFSENNLVPDVHQVVERSGVSLRSVYRYFEDRTALLYAAMERNRERSVPVARIPQIGQGPLDERIDRFVDQRLRLYTDMGPTYRACANLGATSDLVQEEFLRTLAMLTLQVRLHFAPELEPLVEQARTDLESMIDMISDLSSIDHLRRVLGHDEARARRVLRFALRGALGVD